MSIHTLEHALQPDEFRNLAGVLVISPERSILDALASGEQPEQIELAIQQALSRGLTTPRRLRAAAAPRPKRVGTFVDDATRKNHDRAGLPTETTS